MQHDPSPAAAIAAALAARAEEVCRRYLPHGRRQGRYWVAGDLYGARGRSLFVRLRGPGAPGKFTDAATGEHGDMLDLIRYSTNAPTLRAALDRARSFLALPPGPPDCDPGASPATASDAPYDATEAARRLWRRCRAVAGSHAERYLHARGLSRCRFAALRFHPALRYRDDAEARRLPALVAAVTGDDGAILGVQRTWLDPRRPAKAGVALPRKALGRIYGLAVRFGAVSPDEGAALVVGEGIETVLSLITAVPEIRAAAALSAGSLGAFAPPPGTARLVIARDNDEDGALAAERLAMRCAQAGIVPTVIVPAGKDFNDDLVDFGAAAIRARFAPLFRGAACTPARRPPEAVPVPGEDEMSGGPGKPTRREEGADERRGQSQARAEAARRIRTCACREQHRADRPPHEMGEPVPDRVRLFEGAGGRPLPRRPLAPHPGR